MPRTACLLHSSPLVTVHDIVCTEGCGHGREEEATARPTLVLVRHGTFVRRDQLGRHVADATRVLYFDPAVPYVVDHPHAGGDRCTAFAFADTLLEEAATPPARAGGRVFAAGSRAGTPALHKAHRSLLAAVRAADAFAADECALRMLQLATADAAESAVATATPSAQALAREAQVFLAGAFEGRLTLADVAAALDVSPFRLCRVFRTATGGTLHRHLTALRLLAALERLPDYRGRLIDLALDLGFSSHSHFTLAFRRQFGCAPAAWETSLRP